jgi:hypothetical protein
MSDAELVVGARNDAKAVLDEIGDQLAALAIPAQEGSLKVDAAISGLLAKLAAGAVAVTGAFGAAAIAVGSIAAGSAIKAISDESEALDALNRELDNYVGKGRIAEETAKAFAAANRVSLGISEAQTISLMTSASALGVTQDKLDEAALAAIGLSKALGVSVDAALKKVIEGDQRLVSITDSVNAGLREQANSLDGLPGLWNLVEVSAKNSIELIMSSTKPMQEAFVAIGRSITEGLTKALIGTISALQVYRENTTLSNEYVMARWALTFEQLDATSKFFLSEQLPAYWEWFTNNVTALLADGARAAVAIVTNEFTLISEIISTQIAYWTGQISEFEAGARLSEAFAAPFDGIEFQAEKMPEIIGQRMTDRERALTDKLAAMGKRLGKEFSEAFDENLKKFSIESPQLKESDLQGLKQNKPSDAAGRGSRQQDLQAVESRLLTRGRADNAMDKVAKATQESANRLRSIDENLKNTNVTQETLKLEFVA